MRAVVILATVVLAGCSALLGIQDPSPGSDAGPTDSSDGGGSGPDHLTFSLGDFRLAQGQTVRLRVAAVYADASTQDVTDTATLDSDVPAIAAIGGPGLVTGGPQLGTATITARLGDAMATVRATVGGAPCHPVINELLTAGTSAADEWVELYNPCSNPFDVGTWTLVYRAATTIGGTDDQELFALAGQLGSGQLRLYAGAGYSGANDGKWTAASGLIGGINGAVGLRAGPKDSGMLVDSIAYGSITDGHPFREMTATPAMVAGRSAARLPFDGKDDNDGAADFQIITTPTPRAPNVP